MKLKLTRSGPAVNWKKAMSGLVLPASAWTVEDLLRAYVEQVRGNRLILSREPSVASPSGPSGMWFPGGETDLVWAHPAASGVQYDHILGHELGHMVNNDEPDKLDLKDMVRLLQGMFEHTGAGLLKAAMCRADSTSSTERERKAEEFGYFAEQWVARNSPRQATLLESNMRESLDS